MKRALLLLAATMVITTLLAVGIASADPVNSPNAQTYTLNCGGEEVTFVTIGFNRAPLANVVEGTSNFRFTEITTTFTNLDTGEVFTDTFATGQGNRTGLQDDLVTCAAPEVTFVDPETGETIHGVLSIEGFFTPLGG